jgi:hypothetical protein
MAVEIRRVDYYYTTVADEPGDGYNVLHELAEQGINLLAFTGVPVGPMRVQLTVFPDDALKMEAVAKRSGMVLEGPHHALLIQGDDELGVLAGIHEKLYQAQVDVYASTGVADGAGRFGYVLYVKPEDFERGAAVLEV